MKIKTKYLALILLFVYSLPLNGNNEFKKGLYFRSFEVDKDKRTCLNLTPEKPLIFKDGFSLGFDLSLRHYQQNFGYVFRIIANDTLNIDFLVNLDSETANFSLVVKNRAVIQYKSSELGSSIENTWITALFAIDPDNNTISLSLNGIKKDAEYVDTDTDRFDIYFGGNMHDIFSTTDIAPMTIKDIRIFDARSRLIRYWKLEVHAYDVVYDECEFAKAVVFNPQWKIDEHIQWSEQASFVLSGSFYGMAFDPISDRIFIAKDKKIFVYNAGTQAVDTIEVLQGVPFNTQFNQLEYNPVKNELISYQFTSDHLATFNFHTLAWDNESRNAELSRYTHHSNCFIAADSLLIAFGGYGYHLYNSILHKYSLAAESWQQYNLSSQITPRYLGSMGYEGDGKIVYFGGFGNESGRQEEFPRNYYDLYSIDINKVEVEKIWELPNPAEHYTNSNSMIIDKDNRKFYTLSYPNQRYASVINLHEYNLDKPEYHVVGDSIPYYFNDVDSYCDLFLSSDSSELYAVTSYVKDNATEIHIYSMAFPPLNPQEVTQHLSSQSNVWLWILLPVLFAVLLVVFVVYRRWIKRRNLFNEMSRISSDEEEPIVYDSLIEEKRPSSINLLGSFQVVDTQGNDISKNFTPTTTQLFLLLLMSTVKNGQGITSPELRKILWYDKNDDSARNNRNVYINKLRSILKPLEGAGVVNKDGNWTIDFGKDIFCDYERAMVLMKMLQVGDRFNIKLLIELVDVALKGTLLPYIQQSEWLEPYQSDFANQLIECLMEHSKRDEVKADLLLLLKIADVVQLHDNIDEDAIKLKCFALFRLGRKNQALQAFNKFTADYEYLLAAKHNLVFEELI